MSIQSPLMEVLQHPEMLEQDLRLRREVAEQIRQDPPAVEAMLGELARLSQLRDRLEQLEAQRTIQHLAVVVGLYQEGGQPGIVLGGLAGFQQVPLNGHPPPRIGATVILDPESQTIEAVRDEPWIGATEVGQVESIGPDYVLVGDDTSNVRYLKLSEDLRNLVPPLQAGDRVRYDPRCGLAVARVEGRETAEEWVTEPVANASFDDLAGIDPVIERLEEALYLLGTSAEERRSWGLPGASVLLLEGPPGTGKTASARALAGELNRQFGEKALFLHLKAGELEHWLYGRSEYLVRSLFSFVRKKVQKGYYVVVFLDEVEVLLRTRDGGWNYAGHGTLGAFLSELQPDQLPEHICFVMATNRVDLVDPAARRRAEQIKVGRPDARGAEAIYGLKLKQIAPDHLAMPWNQLAEEAATHAYGDRPVAILRFHDRSERLLYYHDFMTGALIEKTVQLAARRKFVCSCRSGAPVPIDLADLIQALEEEMAALAAALTIENVHHYVDDLGYFPRVVEVRPAQEGLGANAARFIGEEEENDV